MFWNYQIWQTAFIYQSIILFILFYYGKYLKINIHILLIILSGFASVPLIKLSPGINGLLFLSDFVGILLIINNKISWKRARTNKLIQALFLLFILWPVLSTIFAIISGASKIDWGVAFMQLFRYFIYFTIATYIYQNTFEIFNSFKQILEVQIGYILLLSLVLVFNYLEIINVDAWWELKRYEVYENSSQIGKGGMFMYRAGLGCFTVLSTLIVLYGLKNENNIFKLFQYSFTLILLLAICIFSGSRQGLLFFITSLILSSFLYKINLITFLKFFSIGIITLVILINNTSTNLTSAWFNERFISFFVSNESYSNIMADRNLQFQEYSEKFNQSYYYILGRGLGGDKLQTESDYINTLGYFGLGGIIFYLNFIIRFIMKNLIKNGHYRLILLIFLFAVLFGIQQWFIMTWDPSNGSNNILVLFFIGLGLLKLKPSANPSE